MTRLPRMVGPLVLAATQLMASGCKTSCNNSDPKMTVDALVIDQRAGAIDSLKKMEPPAPAISDFAGTGLSFGVGNSWIVESVEPGSLAHQAGIPVGSRILEISGVRVENLGQKEVLSILMDLREKDPDARFSISFDPPTQEPKLKIAVNNDSFLRH